MDIKEGAMNYINMFRRYGWTVDILGHNDFVAYNDVYFVPFSMSGDRFVYAVSYLLCDKDEFVSAWKRSTAYCPIGVFAYHDYTLGNLRGNKFQQFGALGNHDHDMFEIASWLKKIRDNRRKDNKQ